jgi:hypothetical protein
MTFIRNCVASFSVSEERRGGLTEVESARATTQTRTKFLQGRSLKVDWPRVRCCCCNSQPPVQIPAFRSSVYTLEPAIIYRDWQKYGILCVVPPHPPRKALGTPGFRPLLRPSQKLDSVFFHNFYLSTQLCASWYLSCGRTPDLSSKYNNV